MESIKKRDRFYYRNAMFNKEQYLENLIKGEIDFPLIGYEEQKKIASVCLCLFKLLVDANWKL